MTKQELLKVLPKKQCPLHKEFDMECERCHDIMKYNDGVDDCLSALLSLPSVEQMKEDNMRYFEDWSNIKQERDTLLRTKENYSIIIDEMRRLSIVKSAKVEELQTANEFYRKAIAKIQQSYWDRVIELEEKLARAEEALKKIALKEE